MSTVCPNTHTHSLHTNIQSKYWFPRMHFTRHETKQHSVNVTVWPLNLRHCLTHKYHIFDTLYMLFQGPVYEPAASYTLTLKCIQRHVQRLMLPWRCEILLVTARAKYTGKYPKLTYCLIRPWHCTKIWMYLTSSDHI